MGTDGSHRQAWRWGASPKGKLRACGGYAGYHLPQRGFSCRPGSPLRGPPPPFRFLLQTTLGRGGELLISHPGHLPISAKPQPAGSKSDFLSREAASSLARLQLEMLRIGGEGGGGSPPPPPTSEHPRLEMSRPPGRLHFPGGTPGAGLSGPALSSPESPTIRRSPPGSAPCPGRPALPPSHPRRCLRSSRGCPPGLERSLRPDLVIMSHSPGNRGPRSIWLRLRTFVSRCATIYRRKTGRIVIS